MVDNIDFEAMSSYDTARKLYFFISIRTNQNKNILGRISDSELCLSSYGKIADRSVEILNTIHDAIHIEKYIIMPNHVHFLMSIKKAGFEYVPTDSQLRKFIEQICEDYKTYSVNNIREFIEGATSMGVPADHELNLWHKGCHIRGINSMYDYKKATHHIRSNIKEWKLDRYYSE